MDMVFILGSMEGPMKAPGKTTTCMDKESTSGVMVVATMENITWTRNMGMECTTGQMEGDMKGNGQMANNMEKENT